jgi:hypothetical protein
VSRSTADVSLSSDHASTGSLLGRIIDLEEQLATTRNELAGTQDRLSSKTAELHGRIDAATEDFVQRLQGLQETRRTDISRAISSEKRGALIFMFGVACNLAANLVH